MYRIFSRAYVFLVLISAALYAASCVTPPPTPKTIRDLIAPIELVAGKTDTLFVPDLFYAESYALTFEPNPLIDIWNDTASKKLALTPKPDAEGWLKLAFSQGSSQYKIPVRVKRLIQHTFRYTPRGTEKTVYLMGGFNNWNRSSLPMTLNGGVYEKTLALDDGRYEYKFVVDGVETVDENNPVKQPNGFGGFNSILLLAPLHPEKTTLHQLEKRIKNDYTELHFYYESQPKSSEQKQNDTKQIEQRNKKLVAASISAFIGNQSIPDTELQIVDDRIIIKLKQAAIRGEQIVRLAVTEAGRATELQTVKLRDGKPLGATESVPFGAKSYGAAWSWNDAILYSILIDRFSNGDTTNDNPVKRDSLYKPANWNGGDLRGVIQKLDDGYFDSLGVNVLWLSPVYQTTPKAYREYPPPHRYYTGYHGYWPTRSDSIDAHFGDMETMKELVVKAHNRNMKVLLDFVGHHVHIEHPIFKEHPEWFGTLDLPNGRKNLRLWDEYRLTTWFEPYLPSFDFSNRDALEFMTDNAVWWLKNTGIDGFRHDAVKHTPNEFWRRLTQKIKAQIEIPEKRIVYQIGETFGGNDLIASYVKNGQLSAQFDFNLYDNAIYTFLSGKGSMVSIDNGLRSAHRVYGITNQMGNMMDSHDKVRFAALAERDIRPDEDAGQVAWTRPPTIDSASTYKKVCLYMAYLMTITGVPVIYYGDEIAMTGAADPDNRRMMRFGNAVNEKERVVFANVRQLTKVRETHSALRHGDYKALFLSTDAMVFLRSDMNEKILVALNKGETPQKVSVKLPPFYHFTKAISLLNTTSYTVSSDELTLDIPALGYEVIRVE
jgi:cyclomaltodextrinase / maltogenic alpha-amylase / neopullulanase